MRSKYDNDFKLKVLETDACKLVATTKYNAFLNNNGYYETFNDNGEVIYTNAMNEFLKWMKADEVLECAHLLNESKRRKYMKARKKTENLILSGHAIFITLTFRDETLSKTTLETRRRYVSRYLKANSQTYVANLDYGHLNGREHYHAIAQDDINLKDWHKYGAIKIERVPTVQDDFNRVVKYVVKLTRHALKVKGNVPRLIYSRDVKYNIDAPTT